jgi:hypothetical protein
MYGERRGTYRVLVENPVGKTPLVRRRHSLKDTIKMDFHEVGCGGAWNGSMWLRIGSGGGLL